MSAMTQSQFELFKKELDYTFENSEFYRKKYERQRWEAEAIRRREELDDEEIRRNLNDENDDEARRRDWIAADEKLDRAKKGAPRK